jgi:CBS domain-containing protein
MQYYPPMEKRFQKHPFSYLVNHNPKTLLQDIVRNSIIPQFCRNGISILTEERNMGTLKQYIASKCLKTTLSPEDYVVDAVNAMHRNKEPFVLIQENSEVVGIFTQTDLTNRVVAKHLDPKTTRLSSVMTKNVLTFDIDEAIDDCLHKLKGLEMRDLPVLHNGKPVAVLSQSRLLQYALEEMKEERAHLIHYITG